MYGKDTDILRVVTLAVTLTFITLQERYIGDKGIALQKPSQMKHLNPKTPIMT